MLECIQSTGGDRSKGEVEEKKEGGGGWVGRGPGIMHALSAPPVTLPAQNMTRCCDISSCDPLVAKTVDIL